MLAQVRSAAQAPDEAALRARVLAYLNANYPDLASLEGSGPSTLAPSKRHSRGLSLTKVPSRPSRPGTPAAGASRAGRSLADDIAYWAERRSEAQAALAAAEAALPGALAAARAALADILRRAQDLSLQRYELSDAIGALLSELDSSRVPDSTDGESTDGGWGFGDGDGGKRAPTLLEQAEGTHARLARARAALAWARVLERALRQRDRVLDPVAHVPSPLAALPLFRRLGDGVADTERQLPPGMALIDELRGVRDDAWDGLKRALGDRLVAAAGAIGWPRRIEYANADPEQRRAFEYAYADMLALQAEGERLGLRPTPSEPAWASGVGLYPLQALIKPIELRFKYHFQGQRSTNRADKPEWAFASVRDTLHDLAPFLMSVLQPLTSRSYPGASIDVKAEFTMLLFPLLLGFLRVRIPALLDHPALLAHTVYQCVLFDESIREGGFALAKTSLYEAGEWEGLTGAVLREEGWFGSWLAGEKAFAERTLNEIISDPGAWAVSDEDGPDGPELPATESARRVAALIEQITDRYAPLPRLEYRAAFLRGVQLPLLAAYGTRVAGTLDAFETLSSAFVRHVPGALSGRPDARLRGAAGLERLLRAQVSAAYVLAAVRGWADDPLFVGMSAELAPDTPDTSVWEAAGERFARLAFRAEDMGVAQAASCVEGALRPSTAAWVVADADENLDAPTVAALAEYARQLACLRVLPAPAQLRMYRRITARVAAALAEKIAYATFNAPGGAKFLHAVRDWMAAAQGALGPRGSLDAPWRRLEETGMVLALPSESPDGGVTFAQGMAAAWGGDEAYASLQERLGVRELSRAEVQDVLRKREECWR